MFSNTQFSQIYMDYAATTPVDPRVKEAMDPYFTEKFGNPSSIHQFGQDALEAIENARIQVAQLIHAEPEEVVFTSGGTESDNSALFSAYYAFRDKGNHVITTAIEHHAVLHCCAFLEKLGAKVTYVQPDFEGIVHVEDIEKAITPSTVLISVMHANNEIGTIQPVEEIGQLAKTQGILFHTDAVQTVGHIPVDVQKMQVDFLSLSAHKLYGPKGVGALYVRKGTPFVPFLHGGGQENGRRSSTHNVPGIVGLGKAAEIAREEMEEESRRIAKLRDGLLQALQSRISGIHLNGHRTSRLPNNLNISVDHVEGESLLMNLDLEGIAVSSGSACSSASQEPSHVLTAIGLSPERARETVRLTLGRFTTETECNRVVEAMSEIVARLRKLSSFGGNP